MDCVEFQAEGNDIKLSGGSMALIWPFIYVLMFSLKLRAGIFPTLGVIQYELLQKNSTSIYLFFLDEVFKKC